MNTNIYMQKKKNKWMKLSLFIQLGGFDELVFIHSVVHYTLFTQS